MDDRTPFEKASKLEGANLAGYREYKKKFGKPDPEYVECPKCGEAMLGTMKPDGCPECQAKADKAKAEAVPEHQKTKNILAQRVDKSLLGREKNSPSNGYQPDRD